MRHPSVPLLAVFALVGCAGPSPGVTEYAMDLVWRPSAAMATSGAVAWAPTSEVADASVEYGTTTDYGQSAPEVAPGSSVIYGLSPATTYHYRLVGDGWVSGDETLVTGAAALGLAPLHLVESDGSDWGHYLLTTTFVSGQSGQILVLDPNLQPVWWSTSPTDFVWSAKFAADGQSILYLQGDGGANAKIVRLSLSGEEIARYPTPYGRHAFLELPNGDIAYIASDSEVWNGQNVVGDQIVALSPDGSSRVLWDSFNDLTPVPAPNWSGSTNPLGADWTHCNGLAYDPDTNAFLISSYYLHSIYKIDAANGDILWQLGGTGSDFTFPDDPGFGPQHSPQFTSDGVLLFDNDQAGTISRVVRYALDANAGVATRSADYPNPAGGWSATLAYADTLPGGDIASTWAERGEAIVFDPDGAVAWHAQMDTGGMMFGMDVFDSFYH